MRWVVLLTMAVGCGRFGFDPTRVNADAAPPTGDVATDAAADAMVGSDAMMGSGSVAIMQSTTATAGVGPQTVTLTNPTTSGSLLVATLGVNSLSGLVLPPGWAMTTMASQAGACTSMIATEISGSAGRQSFTFTFSGGAPVAIQVTEWIGVDLTDPFDASGFGGVATPTTALTMSTSSATTVAGNLAIASFCEDTTNPTFTAGGSWTALGQASATAASPSIISEQMMNAPAAVITATATSSVTAKYAATILTFRSL